MNQLQKMKKITMAGIMAVNNHTTFDYGITHTDCIHSHASEFRLKCQSAER